MSDSSHGATTSSLGPALNLLSSGAFVGIRGPGVQSFFLAPDSSQHGAGVWLCWPGGMSRPAQGPQPGLSTKQASVTNVLPHIYSLDSWSLRLP